MSDLRKAEELNSKLQSIGKRGRGFSVGGALDCNLNAIKKLVRSSFDSGIIEEYRPLNAAEKAELSKFENDEIANAYYARLDGKDYYITYKPRSAVGKSTRGKLEYVNRSTAFVENLLQKIGAEYSFLYCRSRVKNLAEPKKTHAAEGFKCKLTPLKKENSSNKYELFFLIECVDSIDPAERLANIIDSVLLDVDGESADFFSQMSYSKLERDDSDDLAASHISVDNGVRGQLNGIITQIRTNAGARTKIIDFLAKSEGSELSRYFVRRNDAFKINYSESVSSAAAANAVVTCRLMPIGVFLNEIENYSFTYEIKDVRTGKIALHKAFINPTNERDGHVCPNCGKEVSASNGLLAAHTTTGHVVACQDCAATCAKKGCNTYTLKDSACVVCGEYFCGEHTLNCSETSASVCKNCSAVFKDFEGKKPLSPSAAALPGKDENFVQATLESLGAEKAKAHFSKVSLYKKSALIRCKTVNGGYKYFLPADAAKCDDCGENYNKKDLKISLSGENLCPTHRTDCPCGNTVKIAESVKCADDNCGTKFCAACAAIEPKDYAAGIKCAASKKPLKIKWSGAVYCSPHTVPCRVCGETKPVSEYATCPECGLSVCTECMGAERTCPTCTLAQKLNFGNYKNLSSPSRKAWITNLPLKRRTGKAVGVAEDNEQVYYVIFSGYQNTKLVYNKFTREFKTIKE